MKLPNRELAYVPRPKLEGYLLSATHAAGRSKARFLRMFEFDEHNIDLLEQGLLTIAHTEDISNGVSSPHSEKFIIDDSLHTPINRIIRGRTVCIVDKGQDKPRFNFYKLREKMIRELDLVVLTRDIKDHGLKTGDVGAVVHCYAHKVGFEVEFCISRWQNYWCVNINSGGYSAISKC